MGETDNRIDNNTTTGPTRKKNEPEDRIRKQKAKQKNIRCENIENIGNGWGWGGVGWGGPNVKHQILQI